MIRDENHDCYGGDVGEELSFEGDFVHFLSFFVNFLANNLNQTSNNETSERQYDSLNDTGHSVFLILFIIFQKYLL